MGRCRRGWFFCIFPRRDVLQCLGASSGANGRRGTPWCPCRNLLKRTSQQSYEVLCSSKSTVDGARPVEHRLYVCGWQQAPVGCVEFEPLCHHGACTTPLLMHPCIVSVMRVYLLSRSPARAFAARWSSGGKGGGILPSRCCLAAFAVWSDEPTTRPMTLLLLWQAPKRLRT